ncbi:hypothetical protein C9374_009787 [Naegleria lovaniensis]|uniref:Rho-GAP domain-containing protein n=1 Tax=Naegleria lovaniensis TaxID=51637 RepID=A0AA88H1V1_NAELO|nr:uncharacterized protein C9374_009787 [Naegleria lovaniensis]KAG2393210.1 hypothetical protein C9374_009787 [Naegleria lovaniensis]
MVFEGLFGKKKKVFGLPLDQAIKASPIFNGLPFPLTKCVDAVERFALHEEGIYRRAGAKNAIEALVKLFDSGKDPELQNEDPYTICCVVKEYLKKLPDPLTTYELYNSFMELGRTRKNKTREESAEIMRALIEKLPDNSRYVLYFVVKHLHAVAQHHDENKMSITNLSIVFGPTLFRSTNTSPTVMLGDVSHQGYCVDLLIREADTIFNSIIVNNKQVAVLDDPLSVSPASNAVSPTFEQSKREEDNAMNGGAATTANASNRHSKRFFSIGGHQAQDKRKGLSLIELKLSDQESPVQAGRGLFRPESTRIIFTEDKSKQVTYTTDDITQIVKSIIGENLEESAHRSFKRSLSDGSSMLRAPKKSAWKSETPEDIQSLSPTSGRNRRSSAVEEYTKDLDHASDITTGSKLADLTNDPNNSALQKQENACLKNNLTEETKKQLESVPVDIVNKPLESLNKRIEIRRNASRDIYNGIDLTKIDEKWNSQQLYLEKSIIREEIKHFEECYFKTNPSASKLPKEVKELIRPLFERYNQAKDIYEIFVSNRHAYSSQMSTESPLHQVVIYRSNNNLSMNTNQNRQSNPYLGGRRSISFSIRGTSTQIKSPEFKQLLLKNKHYCELKKKKKELQTKLLEYEKKFEKDHNRKMKYLSDWADMQSDYEEYMSIKQKMDNIVSTITSSNSKISSPHAGDE